MTTVLLADDHAAIRAGVRMILETAEPPLEVVGDAGTAQQALELARELRPDAVLLDVRMPGATGLTAIGPLRDLGCSVLMLTSFALDDYVLSALAAGADGFLVKTAEPAAIVDAVRRVVAGDAALSPEVMRTVIARAVAQGRAEPASPSPAPDAPSGPRDGGRPPSPSGPAEELTRREREVLALLADGLSNQQIAAQLVVAESTVKTHVSHVLAKLGASSRVQAALRWRSGDLG